MQQFDLVVGIHREAIQEGRLEREVTALVMGRQRKIPEVQGPR
jgi:hypothetical protein